MKSSIGAIVGVTMSLVFAAPALSVDIRNADKDTYEISIIKDSGESESFELAPGRRVSDVCAARCLVQVFGVGSIEVDETEDVVIRDGRLIHGRRRQ